MAFELLVGESVIPKEVCVNERVAVRAVISYGDQLLMVRTNKGDYKFPGGGVNPGEDHKEALLREIVEETGYTDIEIECIIGQAITQKPDDFDSAQYFRMKSIYFECKLKSLKQVEQDLDDYEAAQGFAGVFIDIEEALRSNQQLLADNDALINHWVERETKVLQKLHLL